MSDWIREHFTADDLGVVARWRRGPGPVVNLANNELRHPAVDRLIAAAAERLRPGDWNRYPEYADERARFAEILGVPPETVLFTAGSDQAYRAVFHAFAAPGRVLLTQRPNYAQILTYATLTGLAVREMAFRPGTGFPVDEFLDAIGDLPLGSIVAVSNPNGPMGAWWSPEELGRVAEACAGRRCLLVLDEAYAAFAPPSPGAGGWPHVLVVSSFSKRYGLAGARLAVCVCGNAEVVHHMQRWNVTNPVSGPTLRVAAELATQHHAFAAIHRELRQARQQVATSVPELVGGHAETSHGNFVPVRCADARSVSWYVRQLMVRGYAVRSLAGFGMPNHLRISAADLATIGGLIDTLRTVAGTPAAR